MVMMAFDSCKTFEVKITYNIKWVMLYSHAQLQPVAIV